MNIKTLLSNPINSLLDGSFERVRIISQMNSAFKDSPPESSIVFARYPFLRVTVLLHTK